nr:M23 family metallopeptidase [Saccharibacillus deserti]
MNKKNRMKDGRAAFVGGLLLCLLPICLWTAVWAWRGVPSVLAWWLIQAYSLIAVLLMLILVAVWGFRFAIRKLRGRERRSTFFRPAFRILLAAAFVLGAWPALWFAGIGQTAYPADAARTEPSLTIASPFAEPVLVGWGGDRLRTNYHAAAPNERWAYDLLADPAGIGSSRLEDYGIYGRRVLAPAAGTVVEARGDEADHAPGVSDSETLAGNHVYIRLDATGTYLVLAHLMQGSVEVQAGEHVETGDLLARVGNSGSSSEPHLHLHHQRQNPVETNLFLTEGLPLYFRGEHGAFMPDGGVEVREGRDIPVGDRLDP